MRFLAENPEAEKEIVQQIYAEFGLSKKESSAVAEKVEAPKVSGKEKKEKETKAA